MGLGTILGAIFGAGSGRNAIVETVGAFRPNAEAQAQREADHRSAALGQYAAEFHTRENRTWLDALADGLNRLVRPVVTIGLLAPIPMTVMDPAGMARVWLAIATLPPGYWAIVGIVLPFYFGGRMQMKALSASKWRAAAGAASALAGRVSDDPTHPETPDASHEPNAALDEWRSDHER